MLKIFIFCLVLLNVSYVLSSSSELTEPVNNSGPVSNMIENLAKHTVAVTKELLTQLTAKIERITKTLVGNIEVVITSALNQLSQPIEEFYKELESPLCQPPVTLEQLKQRVDSDLAKCTQNLNDILNTFETDANEFNAALEQNIRDIIDLPKKCEGVDNGSGFGSNISCYVEKIADVNKQIAVVLNSASKTFVHTRQLAEKAVEEGRACGENVVGSTVEFLDEILASCQPNKN